MCMSPQYLPTPSAGWAEPRAGERSSHKEAHRGLVFLMLREAISQPCAMGGGVHVAIGGLGPALCSFSRIHCSLVHLAQAPTTGPRPKHNGSHLAGSGLD